jgi:hypothetical protein
MRAVVNGVYIENQTFTRNQDADDMNKNISQYAMAAHPGMDRSNSVLLQPL